MARLVTWLFAIFVAVCIVMACLRKPATAPATTAQAPSAAESAPVVPVETSTRPAAPQLTVPPPASENLAASNQAPVAPPEALAAVAKDDPIAEAKQREEFIARLRDWAAKDPESALAWVMQNTNTDERASEMETLCFGLAQSDPAQAIQMAEVLQQPPAVMENLVQQWAANDPSSALDWANNQPAGEARDEYFQRLAYVRSQSDPASAAKLVIDQIPAGPAQDEAIMSVLNQWGNQNVSAAAGWVATFPAGPLRERALEELEGIAQYQRELARQ